MKMLKYLLLFLWSFTSLSAFAQDYEAKLNAVLDKAKSFKEFAESATLRDEYFEVLKTHYLNSTNIGKAEFNNIINQNLKLVRLDPSLDKLIWEAKVVPDLNINLTSNISVQGLKLQDKDSWIRQLNHLKSVNGPGHSFKSDEDAKKALLKASEFIRQKKQGLASMEGTKKAKELANIELMTEIKTGELFKDYRAAIEFFTYDYYFLDNFDKLKNSNPDIIYHILGQAETGKVFTSNPDFTPEEISKIDITSYKAANKFDLTRKQTSELLLGSGQPLFSKLDHVDGGKTKAGQELKYRLEGIRRPVNSMFSGRQHGECITGTGYDCAVRRTNIGTYSDSQHYHLLDENNKYVGYMNKGTVTHKRTADKYYTLDVVGDAWGKIIYSQDEKTGSVVEKNIFEVWFNEESKNTADKIQKGYVITDGSDYSNTNSYTQIITTDLYHKSKSSDPLKAIGEDFTHSHAEGSPDAKLNKAITSIFGSSTDYNTAGNPVMGSLSKNNHDVHQVLLTPQLSGSNKLFSQSERYYRSPAKFKSLTDRDRGRALELIDYFYEHNALKKDVEIQKTVLESLSYMLAKVETVKELETLTKRIKKEDYLTSIYGKGSEAQGEQVKAYAKKFREIVKSASLEDKRLLLELFSDQPDVANKASLYLDLLNGDLKSDKEFIDLLNYNKNNFFLILREQRELGQQKAILEKLARLAETSEYEAQISSLIQEQIGLGNIGEDGINSLLKFFDNNLKKPSVRSKYKILHATRSFDELEEVFSSFPQHKNTMTNKEWVNLIKGLPEKIRYLLLNKYVAGEYRTDSKFSTTAKSNLKEVLSKIDDADRAELTAKYIYYRTSVNPYSAVLQPKAREFIEQLTQMGEKPFESYLEAVKKNYLLFSNADYKVFTNEQSFFLKTSLTSKVNRDKYLKFLEELSNSSDSAIKNIVTASYYEFRHLWPPAELANFELLTSRENPEMLLKVLKSPEKYALTRKIKNNLFRDYFNLVRPDDETMLKTVKGLRESSEFSYLIHSSKSELSKIELETLRDPYIRLRNGYEVALQSRKGQIKAVEFQELGAISAKASFNFVPASLSKSPVFMDKSNAPFALLNYIEGAIPTTERNNLNLQTVKALMDDARSKSIPKISKTSEVQRAQIDRIVNQIIKGQGTDQLVDSKQALEKFLSLMDSNEALRVFNKFESDINFSNTMDNGVPGALISEKKHLTNNANSTLEELSQRLLTADESRLQSISRDEAKLISGAQYDNVWKKYFLQTKLEFDHIIRHQEKFNEIYKQLDPVQKKSLVSHVTNNKKLQPAQLKVLRHAILVNNQGSFLDLLIASPNRNKDLLISNTQALAGEWEKVFSRMDKDQILDFLKLLRSANSENQGLLRVVYGSDKNFFTQLLRRAGTLQIPYQQLYDYSGILKDSYNPFVDTVQHKKFMHDAFDGYAEALRGKVGPDKFLSETYANILSVDDTDAIAAQLNSLLKGTSDRTKLDYMERYLTDPKLLASRTQDALLESFVKYLPPEDLVDIYEKFMDKNGQNPSFRLFERRSGSTLQKLSPNETSSHMLINIIENNNLLLSKPGLSETIQIHRVNALKAEKKLGLLAHSYKPNIYGSLTKLSEEEIPLLMEKMESLSSTESNKLYETLVNNSRHKGPNSTLFVNEVKKSLKLLPQNTGTPEGTALMKKFNRFYRSEDVLNDLKKLLEAGSLDKTLLHSYLTLLDSQTRSAEGVGKNFINQILTPLFSGDFKNLKLDDYSLFLKELRSTSKYNSLAPVHNRLSDFLSYNKNDSTDWLRFLKENKSPELANEFFEFLDENGISAFGPRDRIAAADALSVFFADLKNLCKDGSPCHRYWEKSYKFFEDSKGGKKAAFLSLELEDSLVPIKAQIKFAPNIQTKILECFNLTARKLHNATIDRIWKRFDLSSKESRIPPRFLPSKETLTMRPHIKI